MPRLEPGRIDECVSFIEVSIKAIRPIDPRTEMTAEYVEATGSVNYFSPWPGRLDVCYSTADRKNNWSDEYLLKEARADNRLTAVTFSKARLPATLSERKVRFFVVYHPPDGAVYRKYLTIEIGSR